MVFENILNSPLYIYLVLPLLIFFGRILDVSMGTIRVIFVARGFKKIAPFIGFFEVLIWLLIARQVLTDISNVIAYIAYAGGFAAGTYIGIILEEKLSVGKVMLRIITGDKADDLVNALKSKKHRLTIAPAKGSEGDVKIIFSVMERKQLKEAIELVKVSHPHAFFTIEDVRFAYEHDSNNIPEKRKFRLFELGRKGK